MLTSSHGWWAWRLGPRRHRGAFVLGAVLPDLPATVLLPVLRARGFPRDDLLTAVYHRPPWRRVHTAAHAALAPAALAAAAHGGRRGRALALAAGWATHLAVDAVSHHDDAWPLLWPATTRTWPSPVSYWQRDHGARAWALAESALLALAVATDRRPLRRRVGLLALALAAAPAALPPGRDLWTAAGCAPDPQARPRELGAVPAATGRD